MHVSTSTRDEERLVAKGKSGVNLCPKSKDPSKSWSPTVSYSVKYTLDHAAQLGS
jgi:hypothetical protein